MRALVFACVVQLLALECSAQLPVHSAHYGGWKCAVKAIGTTSGEIAEYEETLRPGQQFVAFTIPPVCRKHIGLRAVACDSTSDPPRLELRGRELVLERSDDVTGFGQLTVTLYCSPIEPTVKPRFLDTTETDTPGIPSALSVIPSAFRSAFSQFMPPKPPGNPLPLSPILHQITR